MLGESEPSVADVLRERRGHDDERTERDEAVTWLARLSDELRRLGQGLAA
jgi:hypothetical protein